MERIARTSLRRVDSGALHVPGLRTTLRILRTLVPPASQLAPSAGSGESRLRRCRHLVPSLSLLLGACTPLGAWIYDAPRFAVAEIRPVQAEQGRQRFEFVLTGCNLNDYDLMADSLALQLNLRGQPVSSATHALPIALPMRDSARVTVALAVPDEHLREYREAGGRDVPFAIHSVGTMRTPMGPKVIDAWHRGTVHFAADNATRWTGVVQNACRPGQSVLPPAEGRGTPLPTVRGPEVLPDMRRPSNQ